MNYNRLPSFMKVFSRAQNVVELRLPPGWVEEYVAELPQRCRLVMPKGASWVVSVLNIASGCYLHAGWQEFSRDNHLEQGDRLSFTLVNDDVFNVRLYNARTGCTPKMDLEYVTEDEHIDSPVHDNDTEDEYVPTDDEVADDSDSGDSDEYVPDTADFVHDGYQVFTVKLRRKHIRKTLKLPCGFFRRYVCMNALARHVYFNVNGTTWRILLDNSHGKIFVQHGWKTFCDANRLRRGVRCHFQLIHPREVIFFIWFDGL